MRWWLMSFLGVAAATAVIVSTATATNPPNVFVGRYHISGYGVYHRTYYAEWHSAPCQPGGKGGGKRGTVKNVTTIKWETVKPATALVQRFPGGVPTMLMAPGSPAGIVATATVTHTVTGGIDDISCNLDGTEDAPLAEPIGKECGTRTYRSGYLALPRWPMVSEGPGVESVAIGVTARQATRNRWRTDWKHCWGPNYNEFTDEAVINGRLPFASLPKRVRGKLTAIAHGHEVVLDDTHPDPAGGSLHLYDAYNGTNYVTFVRIS